MGNREILNIKNDYDLKIFLDTNQGLIYNILKKINFNHLNVDYEMVMSIGRHAIVRTIKIFDEIKGCKFSTLASRYIYQDILNYIFYIKRKKNNVYCLMDDFLQSADEDEIEIIKNKIMGYSNENVKSIEEIYIDNETKEELNNAIKILLSKMENEKHKDIMKLYFCGMKQSNIARKLNMTHQSVNRIVVKYRKQIKKQMIG